MCPNKTDLIRAWVRTNSLDVFSTEPISLFKRVPETFDDWEMVGRLDRFQAFQARYVDVNDLLKFLDSLD